MSDFGDTFRTLMAWLENGKSLILEARELVCPQLIGEAILTQAQILFIYLEFRPSRLQIGSDNQEQARAVCSRLLPQLEHAVELFRLASNVEFELRAMLLIADFQEFLGERAKAVAIASTVLPRAEALRIENLANDARAYINGIPFHRAREREFLESKALDIDLKIAVEAEENLPKLAKHFMAANDLPEGRYPMVLRECQAMREGEGAGRLVRAHPPDPGLAACSQRHDGFRRPFRAVGPM